MIKHYIFFIVAFLFFSCSQDKAEDISAQSQNHLVPAVSPCAIANEESREFDEDNLDKLFEDGHTDSGCTLGRDDSFNF